MTHPAPRPLFIMVCESCLTAVCWYGEFFCDDARHANVVIKPVEELAALGLEHPDNWTTDKLRKIYGDIPDFAQSGRMPWSP